MLTAHSLSVQGYFTPLRTFGAQVRAVLLDNVARHWSVPSAELSTEPSVVVHAKSGRRIGYGEIVAFAEIPEVAPDIKPEALKKTSDFRLIGHDVMRVELPTKVNGSAIYAIDVQVPGMIYGAILRSPVLGRRAGHGRRCRGQSGCWRHRCRASALWRRRPRRNSVGGVCRQVRA